MVALDVADDGRAGGGDPDASGSSPSRRRGTRAPPGRRRTPPRGREAKPEGPQRADQLPVRQVDELGREARRQTWRPPGVARRAARDARWPSRQDALRRPACTPGRSCRSRCSARRSPAACPSAMRIALAGHSRTQCSRRGSARRWSDNERWRAHGRPIVSSAPRQRRGSRCRCVCSSRVGCARPAARPGTPRRAAGPPGSRATRAGPHRRSIA